MAHVQFTDVQDRPMEFLDLTSLTLNEFQQLVPPFEAAFHAHMATWCLDGKPRTARQFASSTLIDRNRQKFSCFLQGSIYSTTHSRVSCMIMNTTRYCALPESLPRLPQRFAAY